MSEIYQEYANQQSESLDIQPDDGLIRGVKILGLVSRNGRLYPESVLKDSIPLYEGAKVNINHSLDGRPNSVRDYRDRIGAIEHVQFKTNQGLFADFRFNPRHPQAPQLVWDAQNAPTNVGFSHCVEATTSRNADKLVIERIHRVLSVDLVADPATTNGLFEQQNAAMDKTLENAPQRLDNPAGNLPLLTYQPTEPKLAESKLAESNPAESNPAEPKLVESKQTELQATDLQATAPQPMAKSEQSSDLKPSLESLPEALNRLAALDTALQKLDRLSDQLSALSQLVESRIPGFTSGRPVCSTSSWQQTTESERPATTEDFVRLIRG